MTFHSDMDITAQDVMHLGLIMVERHEPLIRVIQLMSENRISAIVVEDKDDLTKYFLISHSDIIDFIFQHKEDSTIDINQYKAQDLMHPIDTVAADTSIQRILEIMLTQGFKRLIVVNINQQPIGIITQADILTWNNKLFQQGHPILVCVIENDSGIILAQKFFREEFSMDLLELFGGSISAITSITSEVLKQSGNLRVIEKDYYAIMLEPREQVTGVLVVDHQSFDLRRKLQAFINKFVDEYKQELHLRRIYPGAINQFKIKFATEIFKSQ